MDNNRLSLNVAETKIMMFGNVISKVPKLKIDRVTIEKVSDNTFLGMIIDSKLTWKAHLKYIQNNISKNISVINKVRYNLDYKVIHLLYCCLVLSYLAYGIEIWGNNYKTSLLPLVRLQSNS